MTPFRRTKEGGESEAKRLNTEAQDMGPEARSREEEASKKEVVWLSEKVHLSPIYFEASLRHAEASPEMPEEPLSMSVTSRQQDNQSDTPRHQTDPQTNRASPEIHDIEKRLRERGRDTSRSERLRCKTSRK
jgi:hypothetical protein